MVILGRLDNHVILITGAGLGLGQATVVEAAMVEGSLKQMGGENWEEAGKEFVSVNPMKRFGEPEEVGNLVTFLLSNEATFSNAAVIPIDGGQSYKY